MKRFIFFLLLLGGILFATYCAVCGDLGFSISDGIQYINDLVHSVIDLSIFKLSISGPVIYLYGLLIFLLFNAIMVLSLVLMFIFHLGMFNHVRHFYSTTVWFFVSALIYTVGLLYVIYDAQGFDVLAHSLAKLPWYEYIPIGSSVLLLIFAIVFKVNEKEHT